MHWGHIAEILKETALFFGLGAVKDGFRAVAEKGGAKVAERIMKSFEESRGELNGFILTLKDNTARENLLRRQQMRQQGQARRYGTPPRPYRPGDEIKFTQLLTKLFTALDEPEEKQHRVDVFTELGNMTDEEFDNFLPALDHDIVVQWLKRVGVGISQINAWASPRLTAAGNSVAREVDRGLNAWESHLNNLRARHGLRRL